MAGNATVSWQAPAWLAQTSEEAEDVDEPPELRKQQPSPKQRFLRAPIRAACEASSLLTKAILELSDNEHEEACFVPDNRRRSMASNVSIASTADLTSDSGLTSPARSNTPSPPLPDVVVSRFSASKPSPKHSFSLNNAVAATRPVLDSKAEAAPRKRSIQFACASRSASDVEPVRRHADNGPAAQEAPRRPCIKFACPARPVSTKNTPPAQNAMTSAQKKSTAESPSTPKKSSALGNALLTTPRQHVRKSPSNKSCPRPKFLHADSSDLGTDGSHFHEFASANSREADWIREEHLRVSRRLTVDDTLAKENLIRRLAIEAEEEAELEDEEEEAALDGVDDDDDEEDDADDDEDVDSDDGTDEAEEEALAIGDSDGYYTDEETGFAESDESDVDDDDNMALWTLSKSPTFRPSLGTPIVRRPSVLEVNSDSSATSKRRIKAQRVKPQSEAPDLPDSTDFVCGTLDEDRPLEEAYLTCMAARRKEKLRSIPQDIDPSFPTSEPENEDDEEMFNPVHHSSDDENAWMNGEMEDLHHGQDRSRGKRKSAQASPRKCHSPPPPKQRLMSPPPKPRGRSPKPLFDRHSPVRRLKSPAPKAMTTPLGSPRLGNRVGFNLAARPGVNGTKSLPRPGAMFLMRHGRQHMKPQQGDDIHVRGAIDIVKGLEKKRQRRKEKFHQKYCNRARRGQIPERKAQPPGLGAERMKELGLLMAGKKDQGNYVLSI